MKKKGLHPRRRLEIQQNFLLQLLFDANLREEFFADKKAIMDAEGVDEVSQELFLGLDRFGLEVDARLRRDYLMNALCRPFPLTAAALGSARGGPEALSSFLTSPALRGPLGPRTAAFGDHLRRLIELGALGLPREVAQLLSAVLEVERARVDNAAALRKAVDEGGLQAAPPMPRPPTSSEKKRGKVALPPYLLVAELPLPSGVLQSALDHVGPENCWERIRAGSLRFERVHTLARSLPMPVTVLSRGVVRGASVERAGAGGVSPLVDVTHFTVELTGRKVEQLKELDGNRTLKELPEELRRIASSLLEGGMLVLVA